MKTIIASGRECFVDDCDFDTTSEHKWTVFSVGNCSYAFTKIGPEQKTLLMHRMILSAKNGQVIDHIDGNGLNNVRSNIRFCTQSQNKMNSRSFHKGTSSYKGVCRHNGVKKKWQAYVNVNQKKIKLGYYETEEQAARAYDEAAKKHYGEFARVNFP